MAPQYASGFSRTFTLYLAPLLSLVYFGLLLFAFLAPNDLMQDNIFFLQVRPSVPSVQTGGQALQGSDGPTVLIGPLGSCGRALNADKFNCTVLSVMPNYNVTFLPDDIPKGILLSSPTIMPGVTISVTTAFSGVYIISYIALAWRHRIQSNEYGGLHNLNLQRISCGLGTLTLLAGVGAFLIVRMWLGKAVEDFNTVMALQAGRDGGPSFTASLGRAFDMVWAAYVCLLIPVTMSLATLSARAPPPRGTGEKYY